MKSVAITTVVAAVVLLPGKIVSEWQKFAYKYKHNLEKQPEKISVYEYI